ncbi:MAG TPA: patatin-like phospholipase family protein [Terriglobales bacterium]|jgi:NTE family protein|nr:patatin-like phospholipase family protein [Terriglobales bacterium]
MPNDGKSYSTPNMEEPVATINREEAAPTPGVALCLSGGGFRAMLFHTGVLRRLNDGGYLPSIDRISSVSGGSITAGTLGLNWSKLTFVDKVAQNFEEVFVQPIRTLASHTIDIGSVLSGVFGIGTVADKITDQYRKYLFDHSTLQDLPDRPRFVINATNVQSKSLWRFSKPYMWDWRVGKVPNPRVEIAVAVGASSAFPPVLSPVELDLVDSDYEPGTGSELQHPPYTTRVVLTDGGVYDNLGLETAWKRYLTVLVSDAGGLYAAEPDPDRDWFNHTRRVFDLIDNQVRSLRKRQVINSFAEGSRSGAYWGIWTDITNYQVNQPLPCPLAKTEQLAGTPTRLKGVDDDLQNRLLNWGYAVCDAAMRKYVTPQWAPPGNFPYPGGV